MWKAGVNATEIHNSNPFVFTYGDKYYHIPHLNTPRPQCLQVQTSTILAGAASATLSPHCGHIVTKQIASTIWSTTTAFVGIGDHLEFTQMIRHYPGTGAPGDALKIRQTSKDWYVKATMKFHPKLPTEMFTTDGYFSYFANMETGVYVIMPSLFEAFLNTATCKAGVCTYNTPNIVTDDNRYCIPQLAPYAYSDISFHDSYEAFILNLPFVFQGKPLGQLPGRVVRVYDAGTTSTYISAPTSTNCSYSDTHPSIYTCDPARATTNVLPFNLSTLAYTAAHALLSALATLLHFIYSYLLELADYLSSKWQLIVPFLISYIPHRQASLPGMLIFLVVYLVSPVIPLVYSLVNLYIYLYKLAH